MAKELCTSLAVLAISVCLVLALQGHASAAENDSSSKTITDDVSRAERVTRLARLAEKEFKGKRTLSAAERYVLSAAASGEPACFRRDDKKVSDCANVNKTFCGREKTVHSYLIRWMLLDHSAAAYLVSTGIDIYGATLIGKLDLSYSNVKASIRLQGCEIPDGVELGWATTKLLDFSDSSIGKGLNGSGLVSEGDVILLASQISDQVYLTGARIHGDLVCSGGQFNSSRQSHPSLSLNGAEILGSLFLDDCFHSRGKVDLVLTENSLRTKFESV